MISACAYCAVLFLACRDCFHRSTRHTMCANTNGLSFVKVISFSGAVGTNFKLLNLQGMLNIWNDVLNLYSSWTHAHMYFIN
jgi:hypothetical protein